MQTCVTLVRVGALVGGLLLLGPARAPIPPDPPVTTPKVYLAISFGSAASSPSPPAVVGARALLGASVTTADGSHLGWLDDLVRRSRWSLWPSVAGSASAAGSWCCHGP